MDSNEIKRDIEAKILEWQKQLDEKDSRINALMEEKNLLQTEISRKLIMSPALKERLMGDVGRLLANLKNDLRKNAVKERDLTSRLDSARAKIDSLSAEIASQNSVIEKLKAELAVSVKKAEAAASEAAAKHEKQKAEAIKKLTLEFEQKLQAQAAEASMQIDVLMREISERE